ncbi:hypothetical protein [Neorhodopirellula pilleata]|uniref:hypothetical protein n=1 Tax=Neorhodopirellula pilleata TaxID=2714738 RepID=UPI0011B57527|nr:hypothetical protein [Neorhodopirellula pilleata]
MKRGTVVPTVILDGGSSSDVAETLKSNVVEAVASADMRQNTLQRLSETLTRASEKLVYVGRIIDLY